VLSQINGKKLKACMVYRYTRVQFQEIKFKVGNIDIERLFLITATHFVRIVKKRIHTSVVLNNFAQRKFRRISQAQIFENRFEFVSKSTRSRLSHIFDIIPPQVPKNVILKKEYLKIVVF